MITKQHPQLLEDFEKLLLVWINKKQLKSDSVSEGVKHAKALCGPCQEDTRHVI